MPPPPAERHILDMIGNTPMLELTAFDTGRCTLFLKLESQNPGGSIKDRMGLAMVDAAEASGALRPGGSPQSSFVSSPTGIRCPCG